MCFALLHLHCFLRDRITDFLTGHTFDLWLLTKGNSTLIETLTLEIGSYEYKS